MAARQAAPRQHSDRPRLFPEDPFPISQRSATTSTGLGQGLGSPPQEFSISEGARHHRTFRPRWRGLHASIQAANVLGLPGRAGVRWSSPRGSPARAIRSSAWARRSPRRRRGLSVGSGEAQPGREELLTGRGGIVAEAIQSPGDTHKPPLLGVIRDQRPAVGCRPSLSCGEVARLLAGRRKEGLRVGLGSLDCVVHSFNTT